MDWFVKNDSVVRRIWGNPDTVLFVFAGAAAEFALNKAVDWLFFTGRLPADPLGRLFSTVTYARKIVFSPEQEANAVIDRMAAIHHDVEEKRGAAIPAWAYRDVLYMLIDYSIRSYELLNHPLGTADKAEVYDVFRRVGVRMGIPELPTSFDRWARDREIHLDNDLHYSDFSRQLYDQYRLHLGPFRYMILRAAQGIIVPRKVAAMLALKDSWLTRFSISLYKVAVALRIDGHVKSMILPRQYISQVRALAVKP